MKVGVLGAGDFGVLHLDVLNQLNDVEIGWICVRDTEKIKEFAQKYECKITNDYNDLLNDSSIDAISVLTPEAVHFEQAKKALEYNKHVLIEKPVSIDPREVKILADIAKEKDLIAMPGHTCRFIGSFAMARTYLKDKNLSPISIYAKRNIPRERLSLHNRTHPVLMALSHDIDLIVSYVQSKPRTVYAIEKKTDTQLVNPDIFWGIIEFENDCIAVLETLWVLPTSAKYVDSVIEIACVNEVIHATFPSSGFWVDTHKGYIYPDPALFERINGQWHGALKDEIEYFCNCVIKKTKPEIVTMEEAVLDIQIANMLIDSAKQQRVLRYDELK